MPIYIAQGVDGQPPYIKRIGNKEIRTKTQITHHIAS